MRASLDLRPCCNPPFRLQLLRELDRVATLRERAPRLAVDLEAEHVEAVAVAAVSRLLRHRDAGHCISLDALSGALEGYDWNSSADDTLTVSTRNLPRITAFTWYVGGKKVVSRRVRLR